ncbi:MAG: response regulator [Desulfobulbaceae bacterium]|nr:response regulator [Desulfobulbaceae bacterium]
MAPNTKVEITEKSFDIIPIGDETILLVEDDDSVREMIKTFLEPTGYNILQAQNGFDAVETSKTCEGEIHLLLTDVIMPKMNGQEVADELKKTRPEMQIIFMSGYTDDVIAHHGVLEAGVNFIQKPISLSRLAKKLREVFRNS